MWTLGSGAPAKARVGGATFERPWKPQLLTEKTLGAARCALVTAGGSSICLLWQIHSCWMPSQRDLSPSGLKPETFQVLAECVNHSTVAPLSYKEHIIFKTVQVLSQILKHTSSIQLVMVSPGFVAADQIQMNIFRKRKFLLIY